MDYDPLLAKLIGYGTDRDQAIGRLTRALNEYFVGGIKTNISLFRRILHDSDFHAGKLDTGYLDRLLVQQNPAAQPDGRGAEVAAIAAGLFAILDGQPTNGASTPAAAAPAASSHWKRTARSEALS